LGNLDRSELPVKGTRGTRRRVRRRDSSHFSPGYLLLFIGLLLMLGFVGWKLSVLIREWLGESPWTRDFFREKGGASAPAMGAEARPIVPAQDKDAWGALKCFPATGWKDRAALALEGEAEMAGPFERLFVPEGSLSRGFPPLSDFQMWGDRDFIALWGPGWSVHEAADSMDAHPSRIRLAWRRMEGGECRLAGRFFIGTSENRLGNFVARKGEAGSRQEFLARLRPRLGREEELSPDPAAPFAEVLAPIGDDAVGVVRLQDGDPVVGTLSPDQPVPVTVTLGGSRLSPIHAQPRTTARAGAVAIRVNAPTHDGGGFSVLWLVPFAGSYKVGGQLWAQSYHGWFRNHVKSPVGTPRELRGIVSKAGDGAAGARRVDLPGILWHR
jgi:hypothetical protein